MWKWWKREGKMEVLQKSRRSSNRNKHWSEGRNEGKDVWKVVEEVRKIYIRCKRNKGKKEKRKRRGCEGDGRMMKG